jgi:hypothetical protein
VAWSLQRRGGAGWRFATPGTHAAGAGRSQAACGKHAAAASAVAWAASCDAGRLTQLRAVVEGAGARPALGAAGCCPPAEGALSSTTTPAALYACSVPFSARSPAAQGPPGPRTMSRHGRKPWGAAAPGACRPRRARARPAPNKAEHAARPWVGPAACPAAPPLTQQLLLVPEIVHEQGLGHGGAAAPDGHDGLDSLPLRAGGAGRGSRRAVCGVSEMRSPRAPG